MIRFVSLCALFFCAATSFAAILGPSPYLRASDSPFAGGSFTYFHLEDFESGALSVPGVTLSTDWVVLSPGVFTDSADADDGTVDGSGTAGRSLYSGNSQGELTVTFNALALGGLPTHAGLVWTDVGAVSGPVSAVGPVTFSAFDVADVLIGTIGPVDLGDGTATGGTAEDRFFGVTHAGGISRIVIAMSTSIDWEVDHIQYGLALTAIPEPATFALLGAGLALAVWRMRRRRQ